MTVLKGIVSSLALNTGSGKFCLVKIAFASFTNVPNLNWHCGRLVVEWTVLWASFRVPHMICLNIWSSWIDPLWVKVQQIDILWNIWIVKNIFQFSYKIYRFCEVGKHPSTGDERDWYEARCLLAADAEGDGGALRWWDVEPYRCWCQLLVLWRGWCRRQK